MVKAISPVERFEEMRESLSDVSLTYLCFQNKGHWLLYTISCQCFTCTVQMKNRYILLKFIILKKQKICNVHIREVSVL